MRSLNAPLVVALLGFAACTLSVPLLPSCSQDRASDRSRTLPPRDLFDESEPDRSGRPLVRLPLSLKVAPTCRLYFNGTRIYEATVAWSPVYGLTLGNHVWMLPEPDVRPGREMYTDDDLLRMYGNRPLVRDLLQEGRTIREAKQAYFDEMDRLEVLMDSTYYDGARSGPRASRVSDVPAPRRCAAADRHHLVDVAASEATIDSHGVLVMYVETASRLGFPLTPYGAARRDHRAEPTPRTPELPAEKQARSLATRLYGDVGGSSDQHCIVFLPGTWVSFCDEQDVAEICAQIDEGPVLS